MILRRLGIEAFGALRDLELGGLGPGLTVLYGPNEAGKSTLLAAVRWLVFGQELRAPERGSAAVEADVEDGRGLRWRLGRRVTPRARRGSLSLAGPDGAALQGDAALAEHLLAGTTWALYRSVFALGLRDLEEVEALDAPEVAGALFSAGAVGAANLWAIERTLGAEADAWWKPSGQKPAVNAAVRALGQAHSVLAAARADEAALIERLQGREAIARALATAEEGVRAARRLAERIDRAQRSLPAYARLAAAQAVLAATPALAPLPENLGERLAAAEMALARAESAAAALVPPQGVEALAPPARAQEAAVRDLAARAPARQADLGSIARLEDSVRLAREEARAAGAEVARLALPAGGDADPAWLRVGDAALVRLEALADAAEALAAEAGRLPSAPAARDVAAGAADAAVPSDAVALEADEALFAALRLDVARLADVRRPGGAQARTSGPADSWRWPAGAAAALALVAAWALGRGDLGVGLPAGVLALVAASIAVAAARHGAASVPAAEDHTLTATVARASARLGGPPLPRQTDLELLAANLAGRRRAFEAAQAAQAAASLSARSQHAQAALAQALTAAGLPPAVAPGALPLLRVRLEAWRAARTRAMAAESELQTLRDGLATYARRVAAVHPEGVALPLEEAPARAALLAAALEHAAKAEALEVEVGSWRARLAQLASAAGAADPEEARHRLAMAERRERALHERAEAEASLAALGADRDLDALARELAGLDEGALARRRDAAESAVAQAEARVRERQAELDRLEGDLERLRKRSDVSRALEAVAQAEAVVADGAAAWAEVRLARWLLERAKARYEEERQPATLRAAAAIFARLTEDRYKRVIRPLGGGDLLAVRADGERLAAGILSQGTRAQLYLAMRLSLAAEYGRRVTSLPMVLDDVLVAFDDRRRAAAVAALMDFAAEGHQVWLFTCHRAGLAAAATAGARVLALEPGRPGEAPRLIGRPPEAEAASG